ncbi:unnamed protein product [Fraxinus pennsylvanica]|uniref:Uncharacterized protein n=1 Tax=Fraxinus pennsylvanica TaxID=56036 RepID=A0AAD2A4X7_9LAMI|nr:unnamed protein product [Fraxinus pennsylvanica]
MLDAVVKLNTRQVLAQYLIYSKTRFIGELVFILNGKEEDDGYFLIAEARINELHVHIHHTEHVLRGRPLRNTALVGTLLLLLQDLKFQDTCIFLLAFTVFGLLDNYSKRHHNSGTASHLFGSSSGEVPISSLFVSYSSGSGPSPSMFGFSSSDPALLGSASSGFASSSSFGVSPPPASFPVSSFGSTSSYSFTTHASPLFGSASSSSHVGVTLPTSSHPSPFESTAPIRSNLFGSPSSASAPSFSYGMFSSRAPANSCSFGSGSTFVSVSFKSSSSAPNASATTGIFGSASCRTSSSGATTTTATISSLSPSIKNFTPATSSVSETQSTAARPYIGDDEIGSEAEQVSESVEKVPIDQMAKIGEDQDEKQGTMVGRQDCATSSMDPITRIIETAIPAKVHVATAEEMATEANKPSAKEIDDEPPENSSTGNSSTVSEVFDGDKIGHPASGSPASIESTPFADFEDLALALQNSSSSQYAPIFNQILGRYGDISNESKLKSVEAKAAFFQLLAKVVEWLSNHTVESLDSGELQRMQEWIDDAEAVGFKVKWLQQRFKNIVTVSRYQERLMQLNEIGEQISATKIALTEMEIRQITLKEEVDTMTVELDGDNFDESNLCEGLF